MASTKQKRAARKNIKKAAAAARKKRTIAHLPKSVRTALGKQGAKVARRKRKGRRYSMRCFSSRAFFGAKPAWSLSK